MPKTCSVINIFRFMVSPPLSFSIDSIVMFRGGVSAVSEVVVPASSRVSSMFGSSGS